jgi:hypothetical protein
MMEFSEPTPKGDKRDWRTALHDRFRGNRTRIKPFLLDIYRAATSMPIGMPVAARGKDAAAQQGAYSWPQ